MMTKAPPNIPRLKAVFALRKLAKSLRADVLADGSLVRQFKLGLTTQPVVLDGLIFGRRRLFQAFRAAADTGKVRLLSPDRRGRVSARVSIADDSAGIVEIKRKRWRFEFAALLSRRLEIRLTAVDKCLATYTLSAAVRSDLRRLAQKADFSDDDFLAVAAMLSSSPETFARGLRARLAKAQIAQDDLLPDDVRYWEHLAPAVERSRTLDDYILDELNAEWRFRLAAGRPQDFASIALTCAAPALVPRTLFGAMPANNVFLLLHAAREFDDPFGVIAALQLTADRAGVDSRFLDLGDKLLEQLFSNIDRLTTAFQLFAAAFIIATAHLGQHSILQGRPAFWRRLVAASHASHVVRVCSISDTKQDGLIPWAVRVAGSAYMLTVLVDFRDQPRWQPDWIEEDFLIADVYGRALSAVQNLPNEDARTRWRSRMDNIKALADKKPLEVFASYPAILEGSRRSKEFELSPDDPINEFLKPLQHDHSIENLLAATAIIYTFGFPPALRDDVMAVIREIRNGPTTLDNGLIRKGLTIAAHIAAETHDTEMAHAVVETCLAKTAATTQRPAVSESVFRFVECAAANKDSLAAASELAARLERLAIAAPRAEMCSDLFDLLQELSAIQPQFRASLSRAIALANLGRGLSYAAADT